MQHFHSDVFANFIVRPRINYEFVTTDNVLRFKFLLADEYCLLRRDTVQFTNVSEERNASILRVKIKPIKQ
jgi:hypothetical protein